MNYGSKISGGAAASGNSGGVGSSSSGGAASYSRVPGSNTRQAANMMVGGGSAVARKQPDRVGKPPANNSMRNGPNVRAIVDNSKRGASRGQGKREDEDYVMNGQYNSRGVAGQRSDSAKRRAGASAVAYGGSGAANIANGYGKLKEKSNEQKMASEGVFEFTDALIE